MNARLAWLAIICIALMPGLTGCSLFSISTPDKPLPQRDLNARMQTREFASNFAVRVEVAANTIAAGSADSAVQLSALRWKLSASKASLHSATQMTPMMALLDTWALTEQMQQYFASGAGMMVFGTQQNTAREVADGLAVDARKLVRGLCSDAEFAKYEEFVGRYVREQPFSDLSFARTSIVDRWVSETNQQATFVQSVGTISQSMNDVSERMRMLGERAPLHAVWETRLALGESDFGRADFSHTLAQANESLDRLSRLAESSPEQFRDGIVDLRKSMLAVSDRFDASWGQMIRTVDEQRAALAVNVREEREASVLAFDAARVALAKDAEHITTQAIESGGAQVRALVREIVLYGILLFIVLLGLPFVAGYYVGNLRGTRAKSLG
jgi:hypothetical protein